MSHTQEHPSSASDQVHIKLAQLGARVLEILANNYPQGTHGAQGHRKPFVDANTVLEVCAVGRSLGLLGEVQP